MPEHADPRPPLVGPNGIVFRLLGNVVHVRWTFLLAALLLGATPGRDALAVGVWIVVMTFAVLLHELGHAVVARGFGFDPAIELHMMGGLTRWSWWRPPRWTERLLTSLAGPGVGFVAAALVFALLPFLHSPELPRVVQIAISDFLWVTIAWGVFNLLPMLPLDGGTALEALLQSWSEPAAARRIALVVSILVGIASAVLAFAIGLRFAGVFCLLFAFSNYQQLQAGRP